MPRFSERATGETMTYLIVFGHPDNYTIIGRVSSIYEAKSKRQVSGDIVVFARTLEPVPGVGWLWDWENSDSYAQKCIQNGWRN